MVESQEDIPKIVASVMVMVPSLTLKTGWAYLKTKRRLRSNAKLVRKTLVDSGVPLEHAKMLAMGYEEELSLRNLIHSFSGRRA